MASSQPLIVLKSLLRELRYLNLQGVLQRKPAYCYVLDQYRKFQVTSEKNCRAKDEAEHNAHTFNCLLRSARELQELNAAYSRGERTVEESANLVGLKLPEAPKPLQ
ncbi:protein FMC1 homolog isoform X2 [Anneissia japonica]|nr:protein FMC1 homolog isoform X2 [Anneissia japonica]